MSGGPGPEDWAARVNRVFFAAILALNIFMFVAIAALEYRAYVLATWRSDVGGFDIDIEAPAAQAEAARHRLAGYIAREMYAAGRRTFRKCALCHAIEDQTPNFGPNLTCVIGRRIADAANGANIDYRFSPALIERSQKHGVWTLPAFNHFVEKPFDFAEGTRMPFPGLDSAEMRRDIAQYVLWSCTSEPDYGDLKVVRETASGCDALPLAAVIDDEMLALPLEQALARFAADPGRYLAPGTPPGCAAAN